MGGEKQAEESLLAEAPDPSSKALSFQLAAALCGGQVFVKAAVGCGIWDCAGAERSVSPCKWQGGDGNGRLKPFSSSDDPLLAPAWGNSFFLVLLLKKIQVLGFHTKPPEAFPLPRMHRVQLSEVKTVEPQMDAVLGLQNTQPPEIHHFLDDFMVMLEIVT